MAGPDGFGLEKTEKETYEYRKPCSTDHRQSSYWDSSLQRKGGSAYREFCEQAGPVTLSADNSHSQGGFVQ